jgi:hypothetical protein
MKVNGFRAWALAFEGGKKIQATPKLMTKNLNKFLLPTE